MILILTTMVRNESKALPRLLRSVAGFCHHVALTDTGSTDDTVAVAEKTCAELGLGLTVDRKVWRDFGSNRTENVVHGRAVAATLGDPKDCYLLLLDADMEVPAGVQVPLALPAVGMLAQRDNQAVWWNVRTVRADLEARYVGRTHEYIAVPESPTKIDWFAILDHCDGGCRSDKYERDERLLRLDLAEKNDTRSMFYLAQSLKSQGQKREAVSFYDRRAQHEDFPEEAWMARLEASRCTEGPEADIRALNAFFTRPIRAEPLADLARRAADRGQHHLAMGLAAMGRGIKIPTTESLYCSAHEYTWAFPYVEMISSFYVGDMERGAAACDFLRFQPGSPFGAMALDNAVFYAKALPGIRAPLPFQAPEGYAPASPCLLQVNDGWVGIIRAVNYRISPEGCFPLIAGGWADASRPIHTRNYFVRYDLAWNPIGEPVELMAPRGSNPAAVIVGYEDQRIVSYGEANGYARLVTAGVHCDDSPVGQPELWEACWDPQTGELVNGRKLSQGNQCEKNWLPLGDNKGYLYGHWPVTTVDANGLNPTQVKVDLNLTGFRGSAAPIKFQGGYLYVVHEVATRGRRTYLHRFVHVKSGRWDGIRISRPFLLRGQACMESCFSINSTPAGSGVVLSCAFEDHEVYTITTPTDVITAMLAEGTHE